MVILRTLFLRMRPSCLFLRAMFSLVLVSAVPGGLLASESGSVLILGSDCSDRICTVDSYSSGFIVKIDEARNAAYVLTARGVVRGSDRLYVLYDPLTYPFDLVFDLEDGTIPSDLTDDLVRRGNPEPTEIRPGLLPRAGQASARDGLYLSTESWILEGGVHKYLAIPQTEHLEIFHLLPAKLVRESEAALDVALLVINDFPGYEKSPVLYMDVPDIVSIGTPILTSGCDCEMTGGISQGEVQGAVVSVSKDHLTYESSLVSSGFSGGPVIIGDYVAAMNLTQNRAEKSRIQARLVSTFKNLVDEWIGLPRMSVHLAVDSPDGARDGIISTSQKFILKASARLDPEGQVLAPVERITLEFPDGYRSEDETTRLLMLDHDEEWSVTSPGEVTDPVKVSILKDQVSPDGDTSPLDDLVLITEEGIHLTGVLTERPPEGGNLFLRDDFTVALEFRQSGPPVTDLGGEVTIDIARRQFEVLNGDASRRIVVGKPIEWSLRPQDPSKDAPISFKADVTSLDRNGKPISFELPQPFTVNVDDSWSSRMYVGIGRLSFAGSMGLELEPGFKHRLMNVMDRGIPLNVVVAVGFGIDHASIEDISRCEVGDEVLFMDYRYWVSGGLSVGFSPIEVCFDVGYMSLSQWIYTEIPEECMLDYKKPATSGLYVQPGIEFGIAHVGSIYGGVRVFSGMDKTALDKYDMDSTEFLIQFRIGSMR